MAQQRTIIRGQTWGNRNGNKFLPSVASIGDEFVPSASFSAPVYASQPQSGEGLQGNNVIWISDPTQSSAIPIGNGGNGMEHLTQVPSFYYPPGASSLSTPGAASTEAYFRGKGLRKIGMPPPVSNGSTNGAGNETDGGVGETDAGEESTSTPTNQSSGGGVRARKKPTIERPEFRTGTLLFIAGIIVITLAIVIGAFYILSLDNSNVNTFGCTSAEADNYDSRAVHDDGTCFFTHRAGPVMFCQGTQKNLSYYDTGGPDENYSGSELLRSMEFSFGNVESFTLRDDPLGPPRMCMVFTEFDVRGGDVSCTLDAFEVYWSQRHDGIYCNERPLPLHTPICNIGTFPVGFRFRSSLSGEGTGWKGTGYCGRAGCSNRASPEFQPDTELDDGSCSRPALPRWRPNACQYSSFTDSGGVAGSYERGELIAHEFISPDPATIAVCLNFTSFAVSGTYPGCAVDTFRILGSQSNNGLYCGSNSIPLNTLICSQKGVSALPLRVEFASSTSSSGDAGWLANITCIS